MTVRVFKPLARAVAVRHGDGTAYELAHEHEGVWVGVLLGRRRRARLPRRGDLRRRAPARVDDPYRFLPTLGEMDLHLVNEGRHELLWTVLGARVHHYRPSTGDDHRHVVRGVGARRARRPAQGRLQQLGRPRAPDAPARAVRASGSCSCPASAPATATSTSSSAPTAQWREKADPMAFCAEVPPDTASRVFESTYEWGDDAWMDGAAGEAAGRTSRCRSTRCTSPRGEAAGNVLTWDQLADELVPATSPTSASPTSS